MMTRKKKPVDNSSPHNTRAKSRSETISKAAFKRTGIEKKMKHSEDDQEASIKSYISRTTNLTQDESQPRKRRGRKRKTDIAAEDKNKKLKSSQVDGNETPMKMHCWICHRPGHDLTCTCQRGYHSNCLLETSQVFDGETCPECQLKSVDGTELVRPFAHGLTVYLENIVNWIKEKYTDVEFFWKWAQNPRNIQVEPIMDIKTLTKKIKQAAYKTTAEFYADAKWIYHNTCICYGEKSKEAVEAKKLVKDVQDELLDMEACPECYYYLFCKLYISVDSSIEDEKTKRLNYEKSFVRLCDPPHEIVWAKVHGHSHWPAKVLKIIQGKAHVRFFGKHEKYDVPINTIYHISERHPSFEHRNLINAVKRSQEDYTYARNELLKYKALYESTIGEFKFFKYRVLYKPGTSDKNQLTSKSETKMNTKQPERIVSRRSKSQLQLPTPTTPTATEPVRRASIAIPINHSTQPYPEDISVSMTFSVDNGPSDDNIDTSLVDIASAMNCSEIEDNPSIESRTSRNDAASQTVYPTIVDSNLIYSPSSSETSIEVRIKEEIGISSQSSNVSSSERDVICPQLSDISSQIRNISSQTNDVLQATNISSQLSSIPSYSETSALFMQNLRSDLNAESETSDNTSLLANMLLSYIRSSSRDSISFSPPTISTPPLVVKAEKENSAYNIPSTSQRQDNIARIVPSTSREILLIDLTNDDSENNSNNELSNLLVENPEIRDVFKNTHQSLHTLLTLICAETCKRQKTQYHIECEAVHAKLKETEQRFHEETEKLRNVLKILQQKYLPEEKEKNVTPSSKDS